MEESVPYIPNMLGVSEESVPSNNNNSAATYRRCIGYENKDRKNQRGLMVPAFPDHARAYHPGVPGPKLQDGKGN
jgi:hypothetical protein